MNEDIKKAVIALIDRELESRIVRAQLKNPLDVVSKQLVENEIVEKVKLRKLFVSFSFGAFQTAGLTKDVDLFQLPINGEILSAWMNVRTAFVGPATCTISVGKDGAETGLLTAQDVKTSGLKLAIGTDFTTNRAVYLATGTASSQSGLTTIQARATSTVNNLSTLTAGVIDFYFTYILH